jgi:anthranilate phosphoribosyltransferase
MLICSSRHSTAPDADRVAAIRDAVTMNAAAALAAYAAATPGGDPGANAGIDLTARVAEHVPTVRAILQEGAAVDVLRRWAEVTQGLR